MAPSATRSMSSNLVLIALRWRGFAVILSIAAMLALGSSAWANDEHNHKHHGWQGMSSVFDALLTFDEETPTPLTHSDGEGLGSYLLSHDGATLFYALMATNTSGTVTAAHIHLAREGENGPIIVNLCGAGSTPACGNEGVIATGAVHASDFVGPFAGNSMSDLIDAMDDGRTYTNTHTTNNPGGELRGQNESVDDRDDDDE